MSDRVLEARDVWKSYQGPLGPVDVLRGVDLGVAKGEVVALVGASGVGKSTLLNVLGSLDVPDRGEAVLGGTSLFAANAAARARMRNQDIGFVFQFHHLLREFSALENVMMPLRIAGRDTGPSRARAQELLARVGLSHRVDHRPSELSGGEQQRTAVARALALDPAIFLADEPSGNLDHANAELLHDLLATLARDLEIAMVVVTHNRSLARRADRVLHLEDGVLKEADLQEVVG